MSQAATFAGLFKKYRLKSEFETLTEFGDVLAKMGLHYEDSIFSHWQKGSRIPHDRELLVIILRIFVERGGIKLLKEANELLASAHQGYLTEEELVNFDSILNKDAPFQVPRDLSYFTGREDYINHIKEDVHNGKHVLIYGPAGMGKTSLAIKLGHLLREDFPDGVLWYRLDTVKAEDVLVSIAHVFGEDISRIENTNNRASFVRSLLYQKKVLIILDNVELDFPLELVIPNGSKNIVIVTSQYENLTATHSMSKFLLRPFNKDDFILFFTKIVGKSYLQKYQTELFHIASSVEYLPLAITILTKQFASTSASPKQVLERLLRYGYSLDSMHYDNKNLHSALEFVYKKLSKEQQDILLSMAVLEGEDFSQQVITYINHSIKRDTQIHIDTFVSWSLVEYSRNHRYRLHPFIRRFAVGKLNKKNYNRIIKKSLDYYILLLNKAKYKKNYYFIIRTESKNISYLFRAAYIIGYHQGIKLIWRNFLNCLWNTGSWDEMNSLAKLTYKSLEAQGDIREKILCSIEVFGWLYYWQGKIDLAEKYTREALKLSHDVGDDYLLNYSKQRLGRVLQGKKEFELSSEYFLESYRYFISIKDSGKAGNSLRYIGETYSLTKKYKKAKESLNQALALFEKAKMNSSTDVFRNVDVFKNIIYTHLGALFFREKNYLKAEWYFNKSLALDKIYGSRTSGEIWNHIGLGLINEVRKQRQEALFNFHQAERALMHFKLGIDIGKHHVFVSLLKEKIKCSQYHTLLVGLF